MKFPRLKLELELIPEKSWNQSLAQLLPTPVWDWFRRGIYKKFNWTCTICGATGVEVHCHEVWSFDDKRKIQYLYGAMCICKDCHSIKHWGRTVSLMHKGKITRERFNQLIDHFCKVNECDRGTFEAHYRMMGDLWQTRSKYRYKIEWGKWKPEKLIREFGRLTKKEKERR